MNAVVAHSSLFPDIVVSLSAFSIRSVSLGKLSLIDLPTIFQFKLILCRHSVSKLIVLFVPFTMKHQHTTIADDVRSLATIHIVFSNCN